MGFVKDKMQGWSEKNPQESLDRTCVRAGVAGVAASAKRLSARLGVDILDLAEDALRGALTAETTLVLRSPAGDSTQVVEDHRTRLEAVKFVAAYSEGLPVARQMVVHGDFRDLDAETRAVLIGSDAVQEALLELGSEDVVIENETASE